MDVQSLKALERRLARLGSKAAEADDSNIKYYRAEWNYLGVTGCVEVLDYVSLNKFVMYTKVYYQENYVTRKQALIFDYGDLPMFINTIYEYVKKSTKQISTEIVDFELEMDVRYLFCREMRADEHAYRMRRWVYTLEEFKPPLYLENGRKYFKGIEDIADAPKRVSNGDTIIPTVEEEWHDSLCDMGNIVNLIETYPVD